MDSDADDDEYTDLTDWLHCPVDAMRSVVYGRYTPSYAPSMPSDATTDRIEPDCQLFQDPTVEESEESDLVGPNVAAICMAKGRLGAAVYNLASRHLAVMADMSETRPDFDMTRAFITQTEPAVLVVNSKTDYLLLHKLRNIKVAERGPEEEEEEVPEMNPRPGQRPGHSWMVGGEPIPSTSRGITDVMAGRKARQSKVKPCIGGLLARGVLSAGSVVRESMVKIESLKTEYSDSQESKRHCQGLLLDTDSNDSSTDYWSFLHQMEVRFVPSYVFNEEPTRSRLYKINLPKAPKFGDDQQRHIFINSVFKFEHIQSIRAAGALLRYLDQATINSDADGTIHSLTPVVAVDSLVLDHLVDIDSHTMKSLSLFVDDEKRQLAHMRLKAPEKFSLFNLFKKQVASTLGYYTLRKMFGRPLRDKQAIEDRLAVIEYLIDQDNHDLIDSLTPLVKRVKNVTNILVRMKNGSSGGNDWRDLFNTLINSVKIKCELVSRVEIGIFGKVMELTTPAVQMLVQQMEEWIDFKGCVIHGTFTVHKGIDDNLDKLRDTYESLHEKLSEMAADEIERYKFVLPGMTCDYLPQIGFVLVAPVPGSATPRSNSTVELMQVEGLCLMFSTNCSLFYKNDFTRRLDEEFGDIIVDIFQLQTNIEMELQNAVVANAGGIQKLVLAAAELDATIAMAITCYRLQLTRPLMTNEDVIDIIDGYHPMQKIRLDTFVPNDTRSGGAVVKAKLIVGPNGCGKSIYLKQTALIVYMAHIGCYVPARSATIGYVDKIFVRTFAEESVAVGASSFMADLKQISAAIKSATDRSFVALDEFGRGTKPVDGLSLLAAVVKNWLIGKKRPHLLVSTHLHKLLTVLEPYENRYERLTFRTIVDNEGHLVNLYKVIECPPGHSVPAGSFDLADKIGLKPHIIERAKEIYDNLINNRPPVEDNYDVWLEWAEDKSTKFGQFLEIADMFLEGASRDRVKEACQRWGNEWDNDSEETTNIASSIGTPFTPIGKAMSTPKREPTWISYETPTSGPSTSRQYSDSEFTDSKDFFLDNRSGPIEKHFFDLDYSETATEHDAMIDQLEQGTAIFWPHCFPTPTGSPANSPPDSPSPPHSPSASSVSSPASFFSKLEPKLATLNSQYYHPQSTSLGGKTTSSSKWTISED